MHYTVPQFGSTSSVCTLLEHTVQNCVEFENEFLEMEQENAAGGEHSGDMSSPSGDK